MSIPASYIKVPMLAMPMAAKTNRLQNALYGSSIIRPHYL